MNSHLSKTLCRSFRKMGEKTVPPVRYLLMPLVLLLVLVPVFSAAGAEIQGAAIPAGEDVPPGMTLRWMNYFYMTIPSDWKPMMDRDGVGYFTGAHPEAMDDPSSAAIPAITLGVTRQKPPKGGDYRAFFADIEKMAAKDKVKNFSSKEEETTIGGRPAVFYTFSAEGDAKGTVRKMGGNIVVGKEPDQEGMYTLIMVAGSSESADKYRDVIKTVLESAKEGAAPLEKNGLFPFGATQESFRHSEGPFAAADGTVAVLDRFGKRIRFFDPAGVLLDEWGTKGKGEEGTFAWPTVIAFAPDGSLYVADEGYSVDANIQHFSRKGEFLGKIKADTKSMGDKGIYKPQFLGVTETGKIVTLGSSEISEGKPRVLIFSPEGKLLASWDLKSVNQMALLPGEKIILSKTPAENDNADTFEVYDLEGKLLREWSLWGTDLPPTPGDEKTYFRPDYIGADREGRIYVYDDSEDGIWIYDGEGRFLQVVPVRRSFGIVEGMAVLPDGDVIIKDRPSGYGPGEPSIHRMKNAFPAKPLPSALQALPEQKGVDAPSAKLPEQESMAEETVLQKSVPQSGEDGKKPALEEELAMLKKALSLREEAASLEDGGDLAGAAAKYRESLGLHDDPAAREYAEGLERRAALPPPGEVKSQPEEDQKAGQEGEQKPLTEPDQKTGSDPGKIAAPEAGGKPEAGGPQKTLPELPEVPDLSAFTESPARGLKEQAEALWREAAELQRAKKYDEALSLYRRGLELMPDKDVELHAARLEAVIPKAKGRAEALWRQGMELQKGKRYADALRKYREGLAIYHNATVEEHVRKLDAFMKKEKMQL
ncbi:MAG: hypothetical protein VB045_09545 [Synergistaceae bacterium]|nr:hypothetical protein [Synergistaceae bacterium]